MMKPIIMTLVVLAVALRKNWKQKFEQRNVLLMPRRYYCLNSAENFHLIFSKKNLLLIAFCLCYQPQGHRDIPRKSSTLPAAKSSRQPIDFSESEREESEYETDGEEDERSPLRKRVEGPEQDYEEEEEEEEEEQEEEPDINRASDDEEEAVVCPCFKCFVF